MRKVSFLFQVDLAASRNISGVATQGSVMGTWVTEYTLNYSMDGLHWNTYCNQTDGKIKVGVTIQKRWLVKGHCIKNRTKPIQVEEVWINCWLGIVLWCEYCLVTFQSSVLRHVLIEPDEHATPSRSFQSARVRSRIKYLNFVVIYKS